MNRVIVVGACLALVVAWGSLRAQELVPGPLSSPGDELNAAFTPDGNTVYFTRKYGDRMGVILLMHRRGTGWSTPEVAPFSGQYADYDPFVSPDGQRLFWISNRPADGVAREDFEIWMVERQGTSWGPPTHLDTPVNSDAGEFYPTVARNGTLYFSSNRPGGKGRGDIYVARLVNGRYAEVESVGDSVNSAAFDGDPFIDPEERYLIFTGWGRTGGDATGDLFVATRRDGVWGTPRRLPDGINSPAQEYAPIVSPDGRWLYFASYRSPADPPRTRALDAGELRAMDRGPLNGKGNVYRVLVEEFLPY